MSRLLLVLGWGIVLPLCVVLAVAATGCWCSRTLCDWLDWLISKIAISTGVSSRDWTPPQRRPRDEGACCYSGGTLVAGALAGSGGCGCSGVADSHRTCQSLSDPQVTDLGIVEAQQRYLAAIETLTADEGDSVTILSQNPEGTGPDNYAIDCCGAWTNWEERRTQGRTALDALTVAAAARKQYDATHWPCVVSRAVVVGIGRVGMWSVANMTLSEQAAELLQQWERRSDQSAPPIYFMLDAIRQLAAVNEASQPADRNTQPNGKPSDGTLSCDLGVRH